VGIFRETLDTQRKNLQSIEIAGFSSWQGMRDSNPQAVG
jgi:hypothetical protein